MTSTQREGNCGWAAVTTPGACGKQRSAGGSLRRIRESTLFRNFALLYRSYGRSNNFAASKLSRCLQPCKKGHIQVLHSTGQCWALMYRMVCRQHTARASAKLLPAHSFESHSRIQYPPLSACPQMNSAGSCSGSAVQTLQIYIIPQIL